MLASSVGPGDGRWQARDLAALGRNGGHSSSTIAMSESSPLELHRPLGRQEVPHLVLGPRNATPSLRIRAPLGEAEDLEAAPIGQDRARIAHEPVESAGSRISSTPAVAS